MESLPLGQVTGHRGRGGELTVKVLGGDASLWEELTRVWVADATGKRGSVYRIQSSHAYRDRLVLKLEGVDRIDDAAALRGRRVAVLEGDEPKLPGDVWYADRLIGMEVFHEDGRSLGRVSDLMRTGGADLLVVEPPGPEKADPDHGKEEERQEPREILIPLARQIVLQVDESERRITVRPPEGLLELNVAGAGGKAEEAGR